MNIIPLAVLLSTALFASELPEAERVARLRQLFDPPVGASVQLDSDELRNYARTHKSTSLRGFVRVKPPKGVCLTVQRREDEPDDRICKAQDLAFRLTDLRHDGSLVWLIKTGEGDFGTTVTWTSRYRLVLAVPADSNPDDPPKRRFLDGCEARPLDDGERRIILRFVDGSQWALKFPARDTLVANQPEPLPYLDLQGAKARPASASIDTSTASATGASTGTAAGTETSVDSLPSAFSRRSDDEEEEAKWHIPRRDTFEMPASNFMPHGSVVPGGNGKCRYRYRGDDVDPRTPMVECRDADGFAQVIIPVVCLQKP